MNYLSRAIIGLITITVLSACAGGISKKTVNGNTTYYQDGKEISQEQVAAGDSIFADQMAREQRQARYQEELKKAPRRKASEPVSIALLEPIIAPGPKVYRNKLKEYWRNPFKNRTMLPLVSSKKIKKSMDSNQRVSVSSSWFDEARAKRVPGDVYVQLIIKSADVLAKNSKTKKIGMVTALVYRAEIASPYLDKKIVLEETVLNLLKNVEKLNTLGANVRRAVKNQVRPKLPSAVWIRQKNSGALNSLLQTLGNPSKS